LRNGHGNISTVGKTFTIVKRTIDQGFGRFGVFSKTFLTQAFLLSILYELVKV